MRLRQAIASRLARTAVAIVVLMTGCADSPAPVLGPDPAPDPRAAETLAIQQAVHLFQFVLYRREIPADGLTYCLAWTPETEEGITADARMWTDPPEALLRRFESHRPPVKKKSVCQMPPDISSGVTDLETAGPAVIFRAGTPVRQSDTEVFVHGGYYQHARNAAGDTYRVRYEGGRWAVVEVRTGWIT